MIQAEQPVSCWKYLSDGQKRPDSAIDQVVTSCPFPNPSEASWPQLSLTSRPRERGIASHAWQGRRNIASVLA